MSRSIEDIQRHYSFFRAAQAILRAEATFSAPPRPNRISARFLLQLCLWEPLPLSRGGAPTNAFDIDISTKDLDNGHVVMHAAGMSFW